MKRRDFIASVASLCAASVSSRSSASAAEALPQQEVLAEHRLDKAITTRVKLDWPRHVGRNSSKGLHGTGARPTVVQLVTDKGVRGWGAARGSARMVTSAFEALRGRPLTDFFHVATGITANVAQPLDFALHDLAGVILGQPVHKMLGGRGPASTDCYSGMIYFDDLDPADKPEGISRVLANCEADLKRGYQQLKVKIGRGNKWMSAEQGLRRDIEVTRAIADRFPQATILVDGNDGFTCDQMIQYLEGIGDVELFWIEEPFRETLNDYRRLREWQRRHKPKTLLADGEARPDWPVLEQLFENKLLDVQLVDIVGHGFTPWRKLQQDLNGRRIPSSPHAWGHRLKTHYVAHLAAGLGGVVTIEGVTCASDDIDFGSYTLRDGKLTVSDEPGFGMKLLKS